MASLGVMVMGAARLWGALAAAALATAGLGHRAVTTFPHAWSDAAVDDLCAGAVLGAGALTAAWYAVTAALALVLRHATDAVALHRLLERAGAPVLRHAARAGACAGLGAALTLAPAQAAPAPATPPATAAALTWDVPVDLVPAPAPSPGGVPADLGWAAAPSTPERVLAARTVEAPPAARAATHTVERGECLWSIAAQHLGPEADAADIARAWPRWYALNRAVVGPDPDLIHPGQVLLAPTEETP
ncbi:LysM peptidoglycan-binding domain-containing protein [Georgenia faecalis]|uniref:LysM peptidoglycan-binding domain-containing protein n=1 Tax=Georgenia faecalis TaxID=2483799 RepID=UPI000FDC4F0C|nr:LysM domain-containing protein [Georgenia faecalis]